MNQETTRVATPPVAAPSDAPGRGWTQTLLRWSNVGVIVLLFGIATLLSQYFLTVRNIMNILRGTSMMGITALGMTVVILNRGVDLSVGSVAGLAAVLAAGLQPWGVGAAWSVALLVGVLLGFTNGLMIALLRLQPFVATLATLIFSRGLVYLYSQGSNVLVLNPHPLFIFLGSGYVWGFAVPVLIWMAVYVVLALTMKHTIFGRHVNLVGANPDAAHVLGINVNWNRIQVYTLSGALAGLAGIVLTSRLTVGDPQAGNLYELDAIAAALIGGTTFDGGVGNVHGTIAGTVILAVLSNILNLIGVSPYFQIIVKGIIIVVAVVLSELRHQQKPGAWVHLRR
ncbi:MAG: ABC transporter permease [candidate division NC10 bacterium]|nr:ABC transporter permease [candidate division NC10 bacterium]